MTTESQLLEPTGTKHTEYNHEDCKELMRELYRQNMRCKKGLPGSVEMWLLANELVGKEVNKMEL